MRRIWLAVLLSFVLTAVIRTPAQAQITGTNWLADFYDNTTMTGTPVATGISYPNGVYFNWGPNAPTNAIGEPIAGVPADNFSAVFTSTQQFNAIGNYHFTIFNNDGVRVYVNDTLYVDQYTVFDNPNSNAYQTYTFDYMNSTSGAVNIRVEYVEYLNDANMVLQWANPQPNLGINLLKNSDFEEANDPVETAKDWVETGLKNDKRICNARYYESCAYQFKASATNGAKEKRSLVQAISAEVLAEIEADDGLVISGIAWAKNFNGAKREVYAVLRYVDGPLAGVREKVRFVLPSGSYGHQMFYEVLVRGTGDALSALEFGVKINNSSGKLILDELWLGWVPGGVNLNDASADTSLLGLPLAFPAP